MAEKRIQEPGTPPDPLTPDEIRHALYLQTAHIAALTEVLLINGKLRPADLVEIERRRQQKLDLLLQQPRIVRPGTA